MRSAVGAVVFGLGVSLVLAGCADARPVVRLAATPALAEAPELQRLVVDFERQAGVRIERMPVGSALALSLAARGDVDAVLVDSGTDGQAFLTRGYGGEALALFSQSYVLVGPKSDPAAVRGQTPVEALRRIAAGGHPFVGQALRSGADRLEYDLWVQTGISPQGPWYRALAGDSRQALRLAGTIPAYVLCEAAVAAEAAAPLATLVRDPALIRAATFVAVTEPGRRFRQALVGSAGLRPSGRPDGMLNRSFGASEL